MSLQSFVSASQEVTFRRFLKGWTQRLASVWRQKDSTFHIVFTCYCLQAAVSAALCCFTIYWVPNQVCRTLLIHSGANFLRSTFLVLVLYPRYSASFFIEQLEFTNLGNCGHVQYGRLHDPQITLYLVQRKRHSSINLFQIFASRGIIVTVLLSSY